jgi:hypothetical protein
VKGCAVFAAIFVLGIGLIVGGFVYDTMQTGGIAFQDAVPGMPRPQGGDDDRQGLVARVLEVAGVAVSFAAIFGAAGWQFYHRERDPDLES